MTKLAGNHGADYQNLVGVEPKHWDIYSVHQFNVLTSLGLKAKHSLLDIGCGGLRGGRLFMAYLAPGNYHGIEPQKWAVDNAIKNEMGIEYIKKRRASFDHNKKANLGVFDKKFDFILAHSVFIHSPKIWIKACFKEAKKVLKPKGKFVATIMFKEEDSKEKDWDYPKSRHFTKKTISKLAKQSGLKLKIIKIKHPTNRDSWVILTHSVRKMQKHE